MLVILFPCPFSRAHVRLVAGVEGKGKYLHCSSARTGCAGKKRCGSWGVLASTETSSRVTFPRSPGGTVSKPTGVRDSFRKPTLRWLDD